MTAFTKFNPLAFRSQRWPGPEPAKPANPAKAEASAEHFSGFSSFSGEPPASAAERPANEPAPLPAVPSCEWTKEDWLAFFDERAGIAGFDGGLPRVEAEARAVTCCVTEWLSQHPAPSPPGRCAWCCGAELSGAVVLPFGTEPGTHAWLHAECWPAWRNSREAEAVAALAAMGIRNGGEPRQLV